MLWSFRPLPDLWTITVKSSFRNGFAHRVNKSILHYWHNSYYVMLATVNQTWALAFHSLPAKSHNRYYKRSCSITTRDRPDSYSMAWKRSLQMCVSKHHVQFVFWQKLTSMLCHSCQVSISWHKWQFTEARDCSPTQVGHMMIYI